MEGAGIEHDQSSAPTDSSCLKRKSNDVGWEYGYLCVPTNLNKVKCKLCNHVSMRGVFRLKQHIAGVGKCVAKCEKSTDEDQVKCKKALDVATNKRKEKTMREHNLRDEVSVSQVSGEGEGEGSCLGSSEPQKLGPINKWTRPINSKLTQAEALKQQKLNKELWKQRTHEVQQYVASWMYKHAIPFNAIDNDEFLQMCEAIVQFGVGFQPPSQDHVRGVLLNEEYVRTKSLLQERDGERMKNRCSIMTDAIS